MGRAHRIVTTFKFLSAHQIIGVVNFGQMPACNLKLSVCNLSKIPRKGSSIYNRRNYSGHLHGRQIFVGNMVSSCIAIAITSSDVQKIARLNELHIGGTQLLLHTHWQGSQRSRPFLLRIWVNHNKLIVMPGYVKRSKRLSAVKSIQSPTNNQPFSIVLAKCIGL